MGTFYVGMLPFGSGLIFAYYGDIDVLKVVVSYSLTLDIMVLLYLAYQHKSYFFSLLTKTYFKIPIKKLTILHSKNPKAFYDIRVVTIASLYFITETHFLVTLGTFLSFWGNQMLFMCVLALFYSLVALVSSLPNFRRSMFESYGEDVFRLLGWNTHAKLFFRFIRRELNRRCSFLCLH